MISFLHKGYRPLNKASFGCLAALETSLTRGGTPDGTSLLPALLNARSERQYGSLPQFTSSDGGPVFTAGRWPLNSSCAHAYDEQGAASTASVSEGSSWSDPDEKVSSLLDQVQQAALSHVATEGWTHAALVGGARDVGVSPAICGSLQNGGTDLAQFFVNRCNRELASKAVTEAQSLQALPLQQRLGTLLRWRLQLVLPFLDSWPSAMALLARPSAAAVSLRLLNELVDEVWHAAGDTSADLTWYAKRAALCSVYSATELYMLTDFSPNTNDTWNILDRQLAAVLAISSRSPLPFI